MSVKRLTDPVYLQFIWNAIETTNKEGSESTFPAILSYIRSKCDNKCTEAKLSSEISHAISDGCIKVEHHAYHLVDVYSTFQRGKSDWLVYSIFRCRYCYECHGPGRVVSCPTCFRVFHIDCLPTASESHWACRLPVEDPTIGSSLEPGSGLPPNHPCPVCLRLERVVDTGVTSVSDLQKIFSCALDWIRSKVHWRTMQKVGYLYEPQRNDFLVYRQINTRMIGDKMRADPATDGYPNRTSLLVELDNLVHNAAVLYGSKNDMSNMARQIRSQMRRAMRESAFCVDCYLRPNSMSSVARLTAPCRVPHRLLWFQHNGWSFRPCKMLYESSEGYEVICFGGRHEREFVSRSRAVDMTFTALELGLRLTPSLKKALDEAEEYKANQSAYDRGVSTFAVLENKPVRKRPHGSDKGNSDRQSPALGNDIGEQSNRKRKAGPKYNSAFGSVDSSSTVSVNSTISEPKRRKSHQSSSPSEMTVTEVSRPTSGLDSYRTSLQGRNRRMSVETSHEFTDGKSFSLISGEHRRLYPHVIYFSSPLQSHSVARSGLASVSSPTTVTTSVSALAAATVVSGGSQSVSLGIKAVSTAGVWPFAANCGARPPSFSGGHTPNMHHHNANSYYNMNSTSNALNNTNTSVGALNTTNTTTNNIGPTPPFSCNSSSSSASSCYSSVSPAALSTTSGLGSSVSDPKSVDASPGEMTAAVLGNPYFCCTSNENNLNQSGISATSSTQLDNSLLKSLEVRSLVELQFITIYQLWISNM
ncbi:Zinc finger MYND domain containing protein 11 [Fasciolopsis buskii]|uniref:Zinc finger MYND domain containing protein 11 n=1 Tax=Fasciolopsis buskii TaxID=27845 RepID=A0A8E0RUF3_9TREM|nr:Zinc finger MYND domain containing protein 11 [Fasciolopsis buski]